MFDYALHTFTTEVGRCSGHSKVFPLCLVFLFLALPVGASGLIALPLCSTCFWEQSDLGPTDQVLISSGDGDIESECESYIEDSICAEFRDGAGSIAMTCCIYQYHALSNDVTACLAESRIIRGGEEEESTGGNGGSTIDQPPLLD